MKKMRKFLRQSVKVKLEMGDPIHLGQSPKVFFEAIALSSTISALSGVGKKNRPRRLINPAL